MRSLAETWDHVMDLSRRESGSTATPRCLISLPRHLHILSVYSALIDMDLAVAIAFC